MRRLSGRTDRILAVVWAGLTAVLLLFPGPGSQSEEPIPGYLEEGLELAVHFVLFFVLSWLVRRALAGSPGGEGRVGLTLPVLALAGYCATLEFLQILIPHRGFEWLDIVFGCLGILLGWKQGRLSPDR